MSKAYFSLFVSVLILAASASKASAVETFGTGDDPDPGTVIFDDVVIENGAFVIFDDTTVIGNIHLGSESALFCAGVFVFGNIDGSDAALLYLISNLITPTDPSTVLGNVSLLGGGALNVEDAAISGSVVLEDADGDAPVVIHRSAVRSVRIDRHDTGDGSAISIRENIVLFGNVTIRNSHSTVAFDIANNIIIGNITFTGNVIDDPPFGLPPALGIFITGNTVLGNLTATGNTNNGLIAVVDISGNTVFGTTTVN